MLSVWMRGKWNLFTLNNVKQGGWEKDLRQAPATAIRMINHVIYRLHVFLRPMSPEEWGHCLSRSCMEYIAAQHYAADFNIVKNHQTFPAKDS